MVVIGGEVKQAVYDLVLNELLTFIGESMDDILHKQLWKRWRGIQLLVYNVLEQVMLDLLYKQIFEEYWKLI